VTTAETRMATKTIPFDPAEHLTNPEDQAELLNDAVDTGDAFYVANAPRHCAGR
jgi:DNA-binding phage protein